MNILFVIGQLDIGGAQTFLLRLISAFPKEHNVYLLNVHPKKFSPEILSNLTRPIKIYGALYEHIEMHLKTRFLQKILNKLNQWFNLKDKLNTWQLRRIIKKHKIEVINSHLYLADKFVAKYAPKEIPKISSFHGCYTLLYKQTTDLGALKQEVKGIFDKFNGIILAADVQLNYFEKLYPIENLEIRKIYYGFPERDCQPIDIYTKYNIPNDAFIFGMVARGDKTKGWKQAIDSFIRLQQEFDNAYLVLVGQSEYLDALKEQYQNNKHIIFAGAQKNPLSFIYHFDVGLLPTVFPAESLPNSVIEYLYCGKPVIATDWAEIPKMIESPKGQAGFIIPVINNQANTQALYEAMKKYLTDTELLREHSKLAKLAFIKFDIQNCVKSYTTFFKYFPAIS